MYNTPYPEELADRTKTTTLQSPIEDDILHEWIGHNKRDKVTVTTLTQGKYPSRTDKSESIYLYKEVPLRGNIRPDCIAHWRGTKWRIMEVKERLEPGMLGSLLIKTQAFYQDAPFSPEYVDAVAVVEQASQSLLNLFNAATTQVPEDISIKINRDGTSGLSEFV